MESTTKGSGRSQPKSLSTTAEMALVGRSFAITGRLQKVGKNGSSRLALKNFGITIGDIRSPESEIPKSLPAGYAEIEVSNEVITQYHNAGDLVPVDETITGKVANFHPNTCLLLTGQLNKKTVLAIYKKVANVLRIVQKPKEKREKNVIHPVNTRQALALDLLLDPSIRLVTLYGKAGTGKTLMAILAALKTVGKIPNQDFGKKIPFPDRESDTVKKLIVCRPISGVGGDDLGFLPGTLDEKMGPWGEAVMDTLELFYSRGVVEELQNERIINISPVTHMRGRTLHDAFVIVDDAQNFPGGVEPVMKTLVSRAGSGTKFVFTGDPNQVDAEGLSETNNGLVHVLIRSLGREQTACLQLVKGERSWLADFAADNL